jgi:hypothetical protein
MAISKTKVFLDTDVSGLVIPVVHNLGGTPVPVFTELDSGNEVYVPLMDARISEIKTLDVNTVQCTFASTFAGYLELLLVVVDNPSDHQRLLDLEDKYVNQLALTEDKVSKSQWTQMNTLLNAQIESLQTQAASLQSQINLLQSEVDAL